LEKILIKRRSKMTKNNLENNTAKPETEVVINRVFDAPRALVWKAWIDCEHVKNWWGPKGFVAPFCKIDLQVGGKYLNSMRGLEGMGKWSGKEIWSTGTYREIVPLERIVSTDSFADEKGNVVPATYYDMDANFPLELMVTVTFKEYDDKTELTLHHVGFPSTSDRDNAKQGWMESLDKLAEVLAELKKA
jgi:uncharacterized protein YndB with AHSA1/START domain